MTSSWFENSTTSKVQSLKERLYFRPEVFVQWSPTLNCNFSKSQLKSTLRRLQSIKTMGFAVFEDNFAIFKVWDRQSNLGPTVGGKFHINYNCKFKLNFLGDFFLRNITIFNKIFQNLLEIILNKKSSTINSITFCPKSWTFEEL